MARCSSTAGDLDHTIGSGRGAGGHADRGVTMRPRDHEQLPHGLGQSPERRAAGAPAKTPQLRGGSVRSGHRTRPEPPITGNNTPRSAFAVVPPKVSSTSPTRRSLRQGLDLVIERRRMFVTDTSGPSGPSRHPGPPPSDLVPAGGGTRSDCGIPQPLHDTPARVATSRKVVAPRIQAHSPAGSIP